MHHGRRAQCVVGGLDQGVFEGMGLWGGSGTTFSMTRSFLSCLATIRPLSNGWVAAMRGLTDRWKERPAHASVPTRTAAIEAKRVHLLSIPACQSRVVDVQRHAETRALPQQPQRKKGGKSMFGKWPTWKGLNPTSQVFCARLRQGGEVPALVFAVLHRSSAARAALRGTSPLPHLLQRGHACGRGVVRLGA